MTNFAPYEAPLWGSDVMVDVLRDLGLPYLALNPGSSFRGLHDSLVNYGGDEMQMIECPHEKIAVALAHGYAKASGRPMAVVLHDLVGLLQGTMGVYYSLHRPRPGARPRRLRARRALPPPAQHRLDPLGQRAGRGDPRLHQVGPRAAVPGPRCRRAGPGLPDRDGGPPGPIYIALDAGLQEAPATQPVPVDDLRGWPPSRPPGTRPAGLRELAEQLCTAPAR